MEQPERGDRHAQQKALHTGLIGNPPTFQVETIALVIAEKRLIPEAFAPVTSGLVVCGSVTDNIMRIILLMFPIYSQMNRLEAVATSQDERMLVNPLPDPTA
jgi:hypothetical protein